MASAAAAAAAAAGSLSLYEVLGIPTSANGREIKAAYRRLARTCHPDVVSMSQREISADEFKKIHSAYSTLSDPDQRATYDRDLHRRRNRPFGSSIYFNSAAVSAASGYSAACYSGGRNWETDQCW